MKLVAVIPARFNSSRLPGKPLMEIEGKPMLWWTYIHTRQVEEFDEVYVATDDRRIIEYCNSESIPVITTSAIHSTHVHRIQEVSELITADYYVVVCVDEPLLQAADIKQIVNEITEEEEFFAAGLCRYFEDPVEVMDPMNIKLVTNKNDECIMLSRSPIPFPHKTLDFKYKKIIGVECYNKKALDLFVQLPKGQLEEVEDVTLQRFLENKIHMKFSLIDSTSLSVDTLRDLETVKKRLHNMQEGER